ncbi:MAG: DUF4234 domain-containing protein [Lachnospiraceae bacterium]|nr:DUF4234 domain-containing protein [Lachnospiraceae bacterium]
MFCKNCGAQLPEGANCCPQCGTPVSESIEKKIANGANEFVGRTESEIRNTMNSFSNPVMTSVLKTDRSLIITLLLNIITCGIYSIFFCDEISKSVNVACAGDGEQTTGGLMMWLLSIVTCGIYGIVWYYKLGNRLASNSTRYGMNFQENGTTVLLWMILGSALCGIGPLIALHILIKNTNSICAAYNQYNA